MPTLQTWMNSSLPQRRGGAEKKGMYDMNEGVFTMNNMKMGLISKGSNVMKSFG